jgi:hypothetical protein
MRDSVAVTGFDPVHLVDLKRKLLLFDKISDLSLETRIDYFDRNDPQVSRELSWLRERGSISQVPLSVIKVTGGHVPPDVRRQYGPPRRPMPPHMGDFVLFQGNPDQLSADDQDLRQAAQQVQSSWDESLSQTSWTGPLSSDGARQPTSFAGAKVAANHFYFSRGPQVLRLASMILSRQHGQNACALFDEFYDSPFPPSATPTGGETVVEVVLNALPTPGPDVAWDDVFAFREDASARDAWLRLNDWINDLGRAQNLTAGEIEDRRADLLHSERTSPGAPVGYVVKAGNQFG